MWPCLSHQPHFSPYLSPVPPPRTNTTELKLSFNPELVINVFHRSASQFTACRNGVYYCLCYSILEISYLMRLLECNIGHVGDIVQHDRAVQWDLSMRRRRSCSAYIREMASKRIGVNLDDILNLVKVGSMGIEDSQIPFSTQTTLVRNSSFQTFAQSDNYSPTVSTTDRDYSQAGKYALRSFRLKRQYQTRWNWRRKPKLSKPPPDEEGLACSRCLSAENQESGDRHLSHVLQRLAEMDRRQERLLSILQKAYGNSKGDFGFPLSPVSANRFQPRLDVFSSSSLQKYLQITLHPDPVRLCDMFLARYNLPHILTGSYDPIELMHAMHGWEQESYGDIALIVQQPTDDDSYGIEVPWKHIDQTGESLLALKVTHVASVIKENWLYQGRSIRNPDEPNVPFETDEFADSVLFLNCPGYTKALLYQSSYDSSGAHFSREPWLSGKRSLLCQLQPDDDRLRVDRSCPWDGRVFGRLWQIFPHRRLLSFACIYLILSQMSVVGDTRQSILATKKAIRFVSCYASKWPRFMQTSQVWMSSNWIHLHFHIRVLLAGKQYLPGTYQYHLKNGLRPARFSGKLISLSGAGDIGITEERFSVAVVASHTADMPSYTIIYLSDSGYRRLFMESERPLDMPSRGRYTGVAVYLKVLLSVLPIWKRKWVETLNEFDNLVGVKIDDLFDPKRDGAAMFDSSFERSKLYFTVLQTLRIFTEWIQESERELQQLKRDFDVNIQSNITRRSSIASSHGTAPPAMFMKEIDDAWEELITMHNSSSKSLLDRIEKKEVETKSFRDGLFSATSVREASRATALNQYILVFTIVTIFYLPLSYVSSLFSMDIFDYDSIRSSQASFVAITITIAVSTWAVSAVVLWLVHDDRRLLRFKLLLGRFRWKAVYPPQKRKSKEDEKNPVFRGV